MKLSHHYVSGGRESFCSQGNNIYGSDSFRQFWDFICQLRPNTDFQLTVNPAINPLWYNDMVQFI